MKRYNGMKRSNESGAVSLFSVVFAMLLITVITVSFLRLMIDDQRQATNNDLAQSAFDSAQAGVEDAKRALLRYKECQNGVGTECGSIAATIESDTCNEAIAVAKVSGGSSNGTGRYPEVPVETTTGTNRDGALNQAYTCVVMKLQSEDYQKSIEADRSILVPLVGTGAYDSVTVEWFSGADVSSGAVNVPANSSRKYLESTWPANRPSVLRTQLMQYGPNFTLSDFDTNDSGKSNTNTVFLYPVQGTLPNNYQLIDRDPRATPTSRDGEAPADGTDGSPLGVNCKLTAASASDYACSVTLKLPEPRTGAANNRTAFLQLSAFYNPTNVRISLQNGATKVPFNNVQAVVDSTGRASDLFRRVESRVDLIDTDLPFPDAAVEVTGNFCKDFKVTDKNYYPSSRGICALN